MASSPQSHTARSTLIGTFMVAAAAIGFSSKAIFIKLAYGYNITPIELMALRMAFALPVYLVIGVIAAHRNTTRLAKLDWLNAALLGAVGYYIASLLDFTGLQYVTAGLERLVLYSYPSMVLALNCAAQRRLPNRDELFAVALCYLGIVFVIGGEIGFTPVAATCYGATLIALSALCYAVFLVASPKQILRMGSTRYTAYGMSFAGAFILAHQNLVSPKFVFDQPPVILVLGAGMAIFATVLPSFLMMRGMAQVGSSRAGLIGMIGPLSTLVLARIFLAESITALQLVGTLFILGGIAYQETRARAGQRN